MGFNLVIHVPQCHANSELDVLRKLVSVILKNLIMKTSRWKEVDISNCFIDEEIDTQKFELTCHFNRLSF